MTVQGFCMRETKVGELVVIRDAGYITACVWIDCEDIFVVPEYYRDKQVKNDEWGTIDIVDKNRMKRTTPCHYVDVVC